MDVDVVGAQYLTILAVPDYKTVICPIYLTGQMPRGLGPKDSNPRKQLFLAEITAL